MVRTLLLLVAVAIEGPLWAQGCPFSGNALQFAGSDLEQARCLLRPVGRGAELGEPLNPLPAPFEAIIGQPVNVPPEKFWARLDQLHIPRDALGGPITQPLSHAAGPGQTMARYFVIHDTSWNVCVDRGELARADNANEVWNESQTWSNRGDAHLYITRDGKVIAPQGRTFADPWYGTKLEHAFAPASHGLFLHIENVQLRTASIIPGRSAHNGSQCVNDQIAQQPGFSEVQMERLALVYIAAGIRAGHWLIPAYHAVIDKGTSVDAHDDPQNFDLARWGRALCRQLIAMNLGCPG